MQLQYTLLRFRGTVRLTLASLLMFQALVVTWVHALRPRREQQVRFKQAWSLNMLHVLGVTLHSEGATPITSSAGTGALIAANHITFIDIFVINALSPSTFIAKSDVMGWPLIGELARRAGTIFLDRGSRRAAHKTQELMVENLVSGEHIAIFPEGTTSDGLSLLPFHGALFQAAIDAGGAVHCATISYHDSKHQLTVRPAYIGDLSLAQCLWNIVTTPGLQARVHWESPIQPPHSDRRHLSKHAHRVISHRLSRPEVPQNDASANTA